MRRFLASLALLAALASGAWAVSDYGDPAVTRLWTERGFTCTAFYVSDPTAPPPAREYLLTPRSWVFSAGHCTLFGPTAVGRALDSPRAVVSWKVTIQLEDASQHAWDAALGVADDLRDERHSYKLAKERPQEGERVFIHGFGYGVENVLSARVMGANPIVPKALALEVITVGSILPGNSGSPVLNTRGELVGIVWGSPCNDPFCFSTNDQVAFATPVEALRGLLARAR